ncbi:MAG: phage tail tape measure protein [Acutalibacteraceae bacterium]|nr:phage tail tape measure protein [Acutalibacteraceae bacterium]
MSNIGRSLKGITIQLGADTTKLQTALKQVNTNIRNTQTQLKDVERLLRLDPTNTKLLAQKQRLLKQAVSDTKDKLATLKRASEEAAKTKDKYDAWKAKYDPIKQKIDETTDKLKKLKDKSKEMERAGNIDTTAYQNLQREIEETSTDLKNLRQDAKNVTDEFGHPVSQEQYDALQREILETEHDLESLQTQARNTSTALDTIAASGEKLKTIGTNITTAGQKMLPVTAAVTAMGTAVVKTSADFESSMSKVAAISGATGDDLDDLTKKAREMGAKTKFSASEAASALEFMSMAGWKPKQMLDGLDGIMNLAAASGEDLASTSDIVTDALTAFGLEAEDSSHFADVLAAASSNANTNVSMMSETFKYVAPVAGALGYSVEDTATVIGVLANNGIKSSQAGTVLRKSINSLVAPSKKATTQMQKLGFYASETIDTFDQQKIDEQMLKVQKASNAAEKAQLSYNSAVAKYGEESAQAEAALNTYSIKQQELATAEKKLDILKKGEVQTIYTYNKAIQNEDGSLKSFSETIDILRENLNGLSDAEKTAAVSQIFGAQASSGILAILKTSDKDYKKLTNAIDNCDGKTQEMAETMQNNLSGQFTILKSQLQELAISFGEVLLPKIKKLVSWLQGVVDKLNKLSPQARSTIAVVSLIVASIGPLLIVIGSLIGMVGSAMVNFKKLHGSVKGFPSVMTKLSGVLSKVGAAIGGVSAPVLIAVAAIAVLVAAFVHLWKNNEGFRNKMIAIWDGIVEKVKSFVEAVKQKFAAVGIDFQTVVDCLKGIWDAFCNFLAPIFEGVFQQISNVLSAALDVILGLVDVFIGIFTGNWDQAWEGIKVSSRRCGIISSTRSKMCLTH